jgi:hypothetical protein
MNLTEFIDSLISRYKEPKNPEIINEIRDYYLDRRINFFLLRQIIKQQYKYPGFPTLPTIKEYSDEISSDNPRTSNKSMDYLDYQNRVINDSKNFPIEKIIKTIRAIRSAQEKRELRVIEVSFLHYWSSLENFSGRLRDKQHAESDIYNMCYELKNKICAGDDDTFYEPSSETQGARVNSRWDNPKLIKAVL